jgi:hypothetical protein
MSTALIGLLGVVIGGLVSGGVAYFLARRNDAQSKRASARLVLTEIQNLAFTIDRLRLAAQSWLRRDEHDLLVFDPAYWQQRWRRLVEELDDLTHPQWSEHQGLLARYLPNDAWDAVSRVYVEIPNAKSSAAGVAVELLGSESGAPQSKPSHETPAGRARLAAEGLLEATEARLGNLRHQVDLAEQLLARHAYQ